MAGVMIFHPMDLVFGVLGVVLTFFVYLAPVPIFYKIHKRKATEGFQAFPYIISLLNCMLWVYYSLLAWDIYLLTINTVGCLLRMLFIAVHTVYAPRGVRITTAKLVVLLNVVLYALILLLTLLLAEGSKRVHILGWICVVSGISVFAAPLSILGTRLRMSSSYHPQTDRQTEVVNCTLETYLWCFTSIKPKGWTRWLAWAEFWYNASVHSATRITPFEIVYGRKPPTLLTSVPGTTKVQAVQDELQASDDILKEKKI